MEPKTQKNELFQTSHLSILICYTIFSAILTVEALLLGWERWALIIIGAAVLFSWIMHIQNKLSENLRLWIYSIFMMLTFFFYGVHETSTFDLAIVMSAVIILYTMTGVKHLIILCLVTYYLAMGYDVIMLVSGGEKTDILFITRVILHVILMFVISRLSCFIIDKWMKVLGNSKSEIEQLTAATDRLNDFLANVSHEIRTPINAVIGLSVICADNADDPVIRENMLSINEAGKRVADQISDILDYSEIDRGDLAVNKEDYMLFSVLNDLVNEIRPGKPENIELIIDVDPAIPAVMNTDVSKLKKILRHLIVNGIKYTKEGGVYVRISSIKENYGVNLYIEVTDTGIGMTAEETEKIYEQFYQANSGRTRSSSGLGLGMAIVNGFVSSLGGFMRIESKAGKGTSVHVSIPQAVVDDTSCMSVNNRAALCLGAFLHFEKFPDPHVREYYNIMVRNIVRGLGVQMHRVDNEVNLKKLLDTVELTHLFVGEEEYESYMALMEETAKKVKVVVVANGSMKLPKGSRVRIMEKPFYCFPVAAVLNESDAGRNPEEGRMLCNGVRALVVDDEPMNLTVAKSVFGRYGMRVFVAMSGKEAIDMCRENTYDIVFMDHMMPGMDGVEAMKRIRSDAQRSRNELPVVALTANAVSTAKEMFLNEGFDGFISKPIELLELERVLKKVLPSTAITYISEETGIPINTAETEDENVKPIRTEQTEDVPESGGNAHYDVLESSGVDVKLGLNYCMNDDDFYKSLLLQFAGEADVKRASMEKYYAARDLKNYEILVHALKSTSKMIGCIELSERAKALEFAAKKGDEEPIVRDHAAVMERYKELTDAIKTAYGQDTGAASDNEVMEFSAEGTSDNEVMEFSAEGTSDNEVMEFSAEDTSDDEVFEFAPQDEM